MEYSLVGLRLSFPPQESLVADAKAKCVLVRCLSLVARRLVSGLHSFVATHAREGRFQIDLHPAALKACS